VKRGRPAFGIVGTAPGADAPDPAVALGFVPRDRIRTDRAAGEPWLDGAAEAARRGDWRAVAAVLPPVDADPDRYYRIVGLVAELAVTDDGWLNAWLDAAPDDPGAWCVHAGAMVALAWELRTSAAADDVLPAQWAGFRRVLGQVPAACARATALAPDLAAPWITLMPCARGQSWEHDRFRELWAEVAKRAPNSVAAHRGALPYWLPRWQGSDELAAGYVAETVARATPGRLLTGVRLEYLLMERRGEFHRGPEAAEAVDAALADLAAAPADHPYRPGHRHLLAYFLTKAGRYAEAVEEFRAIDGYAGAWPWKLFADPVATYVTTRTEAVRGAGLS
jgi:hypothetical protein